MKARRQHEMPLEQGARGPEFRQDVVLCHDALRAAGPLNKAFGVDAKGEPGSATRENASTFPSCRA
jgi:hypothetical protein